MISPPPLDIYNMHIKRAWVLPSWWPYLQGLKPESTEFTNSPYCCTTNKLAKIRLEIILDLEISSRTRTSLQVALVFDHNTQEDTTQMSLAGTRTLVYRSDNLQRSALHHLDAHCDVLESRTCIWHYNSCRNKMTTQQTHWDLKPGLLCALVFHITIQVM